MLVDDMCMNLKGGGNGGFISEEQQRYRSSCAGKANAERLKNDKEYYSEFIKRSSETIKLAHKAGKIRYDTNSGKKYSDEHKAKIGLASSIQQLGDKNSQFNTIWITNGIEAKKVKKDTEIPNGWYKGRK